jgi:hypothetical protein
LALCCGFSIGAWLVLNSRRSKLGTFDLKLNLTNGQLIACRKARLIEWLAIKSGAGCPATHRQAIALAKNQTMQWLNPRSLDAYIAPWAGPDRGFAFWKIHDLRACRTGANSQTELACGMDTGSIRIRMWLDKQHRIAGYKRSNRSNLGRARNLHATWRHFADTSM